ncbi:hypothetical protein MRX96_022608 [Rhipicephalus microplus]
MQECVAKIVSLVQAAVEFVLGDQDSVNGARAFEQMYNHPDDLRIIRKRAAGPRGQAQERIAEAVTRFRLCSIDDFMRMAGVVREKVVRLYGKPGGEVIVTFRILLGAPSQLPKMKRCGGSVRNSQSVKAIIFSEAAFALPAYNKALSSKERHGLHKRTLEGILRTTYFFELAYSTIPIKADVCFTIGYFVHAYA